MIDYSGSSDHVAVVPMNAVNFYFDLIFLLETVAEKASTVCE